MRKILMLLLFVYGTFSARSQNVGVGTNTPKSKLEINGTCRIDTIKASPSSTKVLVLDSATGNIGYIPIDSFKLSSSSSSTVYYVENDTLTTTTLYRVPILRLSLSIPAGTYIVNAYGETYNNNYTEGTGMFVKVNSDTIGNASPYIATTDFGTWSLIKKITVASSSIIYFYWECNEVSTASIRRSRLMATKIN